MLFRCSSHNLASYRPVLGSDSVFAPSPWALRIELKGNLVAMLGATYKARGPRNRGPLAASLDGCGGPELNPIGWFQLNAAMTRLLVQVADSAAAVGTVTQTSGTGDAT